MRVTATLRLSPSPQNGTSLRTIWGRRWWWLQVPLPRAAAAAPRLSDRAGATHLGGSNVPHRGGTPGARRLLSPARGHPDITSRAPVLFLLITGEKGKKLFPPHSLWTLLSPPPDVFPLPFFALRLCPHILLKFLQIQYNKDLGMKLSSSRLNLIIVSPRENTVLVVWVGGLILLGWF